MGKLCAKMSTMRNKKGKKAEKYALVLKPEFSVTYSEPTKILSIHFNGAMLLLNHYCYNSTTLLVNTIKEVSRKSVQKNKRVCTVHSISVTEVLERCSLDTRATAIKSYS